jgi:hypothetical protein
MRKNPPLPQDDALFQLEREIARRADELARENGTDRGHDCEPWRQAEAEVLSRSPFFAETVA